MPLLTSETLVVGRQFSMNEIYSIIELIDLKILVAVMGVIVIINFFLTVLILAQNTSFRKSPSLKGERVKSAQTSTSNQTLDTSVSGGITHSNPKKVEDLDISKLETAIKMIKVSNISQSEVANRLNIEPEYVRILTKFHS